MRNLSAWNLLVKFHALLHMIKWYFLLFSKRYFIFLPFKRDTTIINSFSLYRCKNLLRNYRSNFLQFSKLLDALLNARFSQTLLAFKVVINSTWKRFKVPVDKT